MSSFNRTGFDDFPAVWEQQIGTPSGVPELANPCPLVLISTENKWIGMNGSETNQCTGRLKSIGR